MLVLAEFDRALNQGRESSPSGNAETEYTFQRYCGVRAISIAHVQPGDTANCTGRVLRESDLELQSAIGERVD